MSDKDEEITYGVPRLLAFVEAAYLREAMLAAFQTLDRKRKDLDSSDRDELGNLNATDQALRRAFFISFFAILEQNLDEVVTMAGERLGKRLKPSDLRARGVKRSLAFAEKVLGADIDTSKSPWAEVIELQELRNHLVHYGSGFDSSKEHRRRRQRFERIDGIQMRPMICFAKHVLEGFLGYFAECVSTLLDSLPELPPEEISNRTESDDLG